MTKRDLLQFLRLPFRQFWPFQELLAIYIYWALNQLRLEAQVSLWFTELNHGCVKLPGG